MVRAGLVLSLGFWFVACSSDAPMRGTAPVPTKAPPANAAQSPVLPAGGTLPAVDAGKTTSAQSQPQPSTQNAAQQQAANAFAQILASGIQAIASSGGSAGSATGGAVPVVAASGTSQVNGLCESEWVVPNSVKTMCSAEGWRDPGQSKADYLVQYFRNYAAGLCKTQTLGSAEMISYAQSCAPVGACVSCVNSCIQAHVNKWGPFTDSMCN